MQKQRARAALKIWQRSDFPQISHLMRKEKVASNRLFPAVRSNNKDADIALFRCVCAVSAFVGKPGVQYIPALNLCGFAQVRGGRKLWGTSSV